MAFLNSRVVSGASMAQRDLVWSACACLAIVTPSLLFFQTSPAPSFANQNVAVVGWGVFLAVIGSTLSAGHYPRTRSSLAIVAMLAILLVVDLASPMVTRSSWDLPLLPAGIILGGLLTLVVGASARRAGLAPTVFRALSIAFVVAGILSSIIGLIQVFVPQLAGGFLIAPSSWGIGRAVGNLRQPNSLAGLLLWSIVAAAWLREANVLSMRVAVGLICLFLTVIVLTASRTGAVSILVFVAWSILDRRLSKGMRRLFMVLPLVYALVWLVLAVGTNENVVSVGSATRFEHGGLAATNRYGVWLDAIGLIRTHPWFGVGFGGFNFAWTLTPIAHRAPEGFDHAHNLLFQLATETGLPCTALIVALVSYAIWNTLRSPRKRVDWQNASIDRAATAMIVLIGVHSLLEYPLWYSFGFLTTAFLSGLCVEQQVARPRVAVRPNDASVTKRPIVLAAVGMILCAVFAYTDYQRVAVIYKPTSDLGLLSQRISVGRNSVLFGYYADYTAATASANPASIMGVFPRATHHFLDPPLMMAWARALNEVGQIDKARYVARRLDEFHLDQTKDFFSPCGSMDGRVDTQRTRTEELNLPFQCLQPSKPMRYEDLQ